MPEVLSGQWIWTVTTCLMYTTTYLHLSKCLSSNIYLNGKEQEILSGYENVKPEMTKERGRTMTTRTLNMAVLGAGNVGGTLGRKWNVAGYQVAFGVSDPNGKNAQALRNELGDQVTIGSVADVLSTKPEVVVMALPGT